LPKEGPSKPTSGTAAMPAGNAFLKANCRIYCYYRY